MSGLCQTVIQVNFYNVDSFFIARLLHFEANDINQSLIDGSGVCVCVQIMFFKQLLLQTVSESLSSQFFLSRQSLKSILVRHFRGTDARHIFMLKNMSNYHQNSSGLCNTEKKTHILILPIYVIVSFTVIFSRNNERLWACSPHVASSYFN